MITATRRVQNHLLLVATRRRIYAAGAIRRRAAPDALVPAGAMPVYLVGGIYTAVPIACAAAPLAVLFVVAVLVNLVRAVDTAMTIARTATMPTFARHFRIPFGVDILPNLPHLRRALYQIAAKNTAPREPAPQESTSSKLQALSSKLQASSSKLYRCHSPLAVFTTSRRVFHGSTSFSHERQ